MGMGREGGKMQWISYFWITIPLLPPFPGHAHARYDAEKGIGRDHAMANAGYDGHIDGVTRATGTYREPITLVRNCLL